MLFVKKEQKCSLVRQENASFKPKLLVFFMEEIISFQRGGASLENSERMNESFPTGVADE